MSKALLIIDMQKFMFREEKPAYQSRKLISHIQTVLKQARELRWFNETCFHLSE